MVKLTVLLDDTSVRAIPRLVRERQCTRAQIVREAISDSLRQDSRPQAKGVGAYSSGRTDVSERAEELLQEAARAKVRLPLIRSKRRGLRKLTNAKSRETTISGHNRDILNQ